jgi:SAM-dependent MidA family methyltransferase
VPPVEPDSSELLLDEIRREIRGSGAIPFARFMEIALYHPRHGYYSAGAERLGPRGDFFTASDAGRSFGSCLAEQIREFDRVCGPFDPLHLIEFGAGRGLLARDILDALAEKGGAARPPARYVMVDRSGAMREEAAKRVPEARVVGPDNLPGGLEGCVLAVELFDALPVHRVRRRSGCLREVAVDLASDGGLLECEIDPSAAIVDLAERYGAAPDDGMEAEVSPAALTQLDLMADTLDRGVLIVVDYGHAAADLYNARRARGTLLAYHGHATNERFLARVGRQDLTAHVNFSALEDRARERGLRVLGMTTQDRFLIANGILAEFDQPDPADAYDPRQVKRRLQAMQLIHPEGMGRSFKVLLLSKGCDPPPDLSGLRDPFARANP